MHLVERRLIRQDDPRFAVIDQAAFASKNRHNQATCQIRLAFIQEGQYLPSVEIFHRIKHLDCSQALPRKVSNALLILIHQNWTVFFEALKACQDCHTCNQTKGNQTAAEFGHAAVQAQADAPLADAAAMIATRYILVERLRELSLPISGWSGGRSRWNRERFGLARTHAPDALCAGDLAGVKAGRRRAMLIEAVGRGQYQRTHGDAAGFPRDYRTLQKRLYRFQTGDLVRAEVPAPLKTAGSSIGRVAVRARGTLRAGAVDGIGWRYFCLIQRADRHEDQLIEKGDGAAPLA
jgi:hypothetical protein